MESYQPVAYTQPHHQLIEQLLQGFNHEYLGSHNILFGGGTRIALELKEYRTSVDIDCCDSMVASGHLNGSVIAW